MPSLIQLLVVLLDEMIKWFLVGLAIFIFLPMVTAFLPWAHGKRLVATYHDIIMSLLGRAVLLQRSNGGLSLMKSVFDPSAGRAGAEMIWIKGEKRYFFDPENLMSSFRDHPFGLAHEDRSVIVDARMAYFGRRYAELKDAGRWMVDGARKAYFAIDEGMETLVSLSDVIYIIQDPTTPGVIDRVDSFTEKGNAGFNTGTRGQQMQLFIAFGVGLGAMFLAGEILGATGGGGGVSNIMPFFLGWF